MENIGVKNFQKWDMIWEQLQVKLSKKVSYPLEDKIRDKIFFNIIAQTENQVYFQTLNNLKNNYGEH
jgi:hypothetical protein